jgi:hypothetical protein
MALTQAEINLLLHGSDDPMVKEVDDGPHPIAKVFEQAALDTALGRKAVTTETPQLHGARASADWDETLGEDRRKLEKVFRKNTDGSYLKKSPNGRWMFTYSSTGELLSGAAITE